MNKETIYAVIATLLTSSLWLANIQIQNPVLAKIFQTTLIFTILYIIFKLVIENIFIKRVTDTKIRYRLRKGVSLIYMAIFLVTFAAIWIENVQALLVAYGLIAAGVAVSLQDLFKNIAGGIVLITTSLYRAGDRIEIDSIKGDVIDIGLMFTTLLEIGNWINADQTTGRLITIPHGKILSVPIKNYTKDNTVIWDEAFIPITYESNWKKAAKIIKQVIEKETTDDKQVAQKEIQKLSSKYYLTKRDAEPAVYLTPTDNWISIHARYVTLTRVRRDTKNAIMLRILTKLEKAKDIAVASETVKILSK